MINNKMRYIIENASMVTSRCLRHTSQPVYAILGRVVPMHAKQEKPTPLFVHYVVQLVARLMLFGIGIYLYVTHPKQLDITTRFGLAHGIDFVDVAFVLIALDLISKLRPRAQIAMGSRKQYGEFHVPTPCMFPGGLRELRDEARRLVQQTPDLVTQTMRETRQAVQETAQGVFEAGRQLAYSIDVLRVLPWPNEDLTASELMRESIRRRRMREIVPVVVFWVTFNVALGLLFERFGIFNERFALLWVLFYFLFDMISVVLWCPLQLILMRNRCCTTCQIFNWDGIMTVTPLFAIGCWFSMLLIPLALLVLMRWELAFVRHPERFDERTNASLSCANCKDKLCYLRQPLTPRKTS